LEFKIKHRYLGVWYVPSKNQTEKIKEALNKKASKKILNLLFHDRKSVAMFKSVLGFDCYLKVSKLC